MGKRRVSIRLFFLFKRASAIATWNRTSRFGLFARRSPDPCGRADCTDNSGIWSRTNLTGYEPAISENLWLLSAVNVAHIQNTSVGSATITSLLYSTSTVYVNEVCLPNSRRPLLPLSTRVILILELFVSIFGFKANLPKSHIQQLHLWV